MKKNLLIVLLIIVGLASCGNKENVSKEKVFNVNVNLKNANENTWIYLNKNVHDTIVVVDSANFKNETAMLKAPFDDAQLPYFINIKGTSEQILIFPENQDVKVEGDINYLSDLVIKGGDAQTRYYEYISINKKYDTKFDELIEQKKEANLSRNMELFNNIDEQIEQLIKDRIAHRVNFFKENGDLFVAHYLLNEVRMDYTIDELKDFVSGFTKESAYAKDLNGYIDKLEGVSIGHHCLDFTLQTADGQDVTLSEYLKENKLTLVDFWASWCGPCRGENPFVVAAYEKYHKYGFNVLSVSVDRDAEAWMDAVKKDGLVWTNVLDKDGSVSDMYFVYYIPSNLLIDANGIIFEKNIPGEKLADAIGNKLQVQ